MAKFNGLDKMTYAELSELRDLVEAAMIEAKAAERKALLQKMQELAEESGLTIEEVLGSKRGRKAGSKGAIVAAKFQNPKDPTQTWAGRGRQPLWLVDALKKGQKIDSFRI